MDAANVDSSVHRALYYKICGGATGPRTETLEYRKRETNVWLNHRLLIPDEMTPDGSSDQMTQWIGTKARADVRCLHGVSPDWKMLINRARRGDAHARSAHRTRERSALRLYGNVPTTKVAARIARLRHARDRARLVRPWRMAAHRYRPARMRHADSGVFSGPPGAWAEQRLAVRLAAQPRARIESLRSTAESRLTVEADGHPREFHPTGRSRWQSHRSDSPSVSVTARMRQPRPAVTGLRSSPSAAATSLGCSASPKSSSAGLEVG